MGRKISAQIIADSINQWGHRITTYILTYPRYIHSEFMTHRMFSRNAASSRAVPFKKMLKMIQEDPFIPIAWQKDHTGMQGTQYLTGDEALIAENYWIGARNSAVQQARLLGDREVTKQIVNRILEPFMWYTCIVTATEYDNFFDLRCPQYELDNVRYKSRKDLSRAYIVPESIKDDILYWLSINKSAAEIHISLLAEAMWDARNESKPKKLEPGEWHIPFGDKFDEERLAKLFADESVGFGGDQDEIDEAKIKIATARCARVSYLNFEGKDDYEDDLRLFKKLIGPPAHLSPFEHCAKSMTEDEYIRYIRGVAKWEEAGGGFNSLYIGEETEGWCKNFRGYIQLRNYVEKCNFTF
jgi:thymidylate synthase ThyX